MRLEDIDLIFRNSPSVLGTVSYARTKPHLPVEEALHVKEKTEHQEVA